MAAIVTLTFSPTLDLATATSHVVSDAKLRCDRPRVDPGGGGVNVARAAQRLGAEVQAVLPVGGPAGQCLRELLADEEVPVTIVESQVDTRESWTVTETGSGAQYRFVFPGPALAPDEVDRCLAAAVDGAEDLLVVSGSLPPGAPPDLVARVVEQARGAGLRTVVDTSGPALRAALDAGAWLVKPNLRELAAVAGQTLDDDGAIVAAARDQLDGGTEVVVVSLGAGGALLVTADDTQHVRSPTVPVRSRVGAGDSTVAGIVTALARGDDALTALRWGVAAGAAAVMTPGSELCHRDDVERLVSQIPVAT